MKQYTKWASREYALAPRLLATLPAGIVLGFLIPYALISLVPRLDDFFNLPLVAWGVVNVVLGIILVVVGLFYGMWSNATQIMKAKGTPLPVMPTQILLVSGPFRHCRNPMTFGTICLYLGISVVVGSISSIVVVCIFGALLLTYIKLVEEHELEARFGQAYIVYKAKTPFIIPKPWSRKS